MGKLKDKLKKAGGAALVLGATGGAGAAAALALKKKMEKTTYNIDSWGPQGSDLVSIKYGPPSAFDTSDKLTISGTPFDGQYGVVKGRTRREVWIKPATPVTDTGSGGSIRAKTSVAARLRHMHSAGLAKTRDTAKAAGKLAGKGMSYIWDKIKKALIILVVLLLLYLIVTTVIKAKVTQAVTPAPAAPAPVMVA